MREAALKAGARQVSVIEEPMAAAIGAGLPISEAHRQHDRGHRRRHRLRSLSSLWAASWPPAASGWPAICSIRPSFALSSASITCSSVSAPPSRSRSRSARPTLMDPEHDHGDQGPQPGGRPAQEHRCVHSEDVREALLECLVKITSAIKETLERTPPELSCRHHRPRHHPDRRRRPAARPGSS